MKSDSQYRMAALIPSGFFLVRSSLLSIRSFLQWGADLEAAHAGASSGVLERAWQRDCATLRRRLEKTMREGPIREALFVASPGFEGRFEARVKDEHSKRGRSYERALVRYLSRLSGRATPLGLAAGCTYGTIGPRTVVELLGQEHYRRHTGIDVDHLAALVDRLVLQSRPRHSLRLCINSSLFSVADRFHYVAAEPSQDDYSYAPMAVERTPLLAAVLEAARSGVNLTELAAKLRELVPALGEEKSLALIRELIARQILVPSCAPVVTGAEPLDRLIDDLEPHPEAAAVVQILSATRDALCSIDTTRVNVPARYRRTALGLEAMPVKADLSRLFQVDLIKPAAEATLGEDVIGEITKGVHWLHQWCGPGSPDPLDAFRSAFRQRYGEREVRLVEVLDPDIGIGFPSPDEPTSASPLLSDLPLPDDEPKDPTWDVRQDLLLSRLGRALEKGADEIRMQPGDLKLLQSMPRPPPLPTSLSVKGSLAATSAEALNRGEFRFFLHGAMGPPATIFLGRICQFDERLRNAVREMLRNEEAATPDAIVAEVVYCPRGRLANIQTRPILSEFEIPYLGRSALPKDRQIPVTDLWISMRGETVILRSARLGRRVVPRLSSAHDFRRDTVATYRFLGSLQLQGVCWWLRWDWGALAGARFLPRVTMGRLVFSAATWNLERTELRSLAKYAGARRFAAVRQWQIARGVPRHALLVDADEKMLCDFDNALSVETFVELVKNRASVALEEMLPHTGELAVSGPEGPFVHEFVVPFLTGVEQTAPDGVPAPAQIRASSPTKLPGSDWLFVKVYSGTVTADWLLREFVAPLVDEIDPDAMRGWFLVRYADPDPHLRLRFHGDSAYLQAEFLPCLNERLESLRNQDKLWRVVIDTYQREVERYGGSAGLSLAERLFHADSIAALAVLSSCPGDIGAEARWQLTLRGIDLLLDDFDLSLGARARLVHRIRTSFNREFQADRGPLKHRLGQKFRRERQRVEALLDAARSPAPQLTAGLRALRNRSRSLQPVVAQLQALQRNGALSRSIEELLPSYIHMQCNRLLRWPHRPQEMVLYDLLGRHYDSQVARARG